jgi:hypothetical protein
MGENDNLKLLEDDAFAALKLFQQALEPGADPGKILNCQLFNKYKKQLVDEKYITFVEKKYIDGLCDYLNMLLLPNALIALE